MVRLFREFFPGFRCERGSYFGVDFGGCRSAKAEPVRSVSKLRAKPLWELNVGREVPT